MKTTKKALLSSVLCIVLCLSMLVGTTFAWFTDSVTTGANKIQSGILKIDLQHVTENGSVSLKEHPDHEVISSDILWEPGYTALATLRIVNKGNLALKYILSLNVEADAVNKKLAEVIDVYTLVGQMGEGRPDLTDTKTWNKVGSLYELITKTGGAANGILLPKGATPKAGKEDVEIVEAIETTFVLHMREDAGNEYQNLNLGAVYMNLFATQYTYEEDSFDDQYDAEKTYDHYVMTFADLEAAFAEGGSILVLNDIEWERLIWLRSGKEVYLDMNGKTMTPIAGMKSNCFLATEINTKLVIDGNGTYNLGDRYDIAFLYPAGDVVIENGTYIRNRVPAGVESHTMFIGVKESAMGKPLGTTVINGGYFDGGYYDANAKTFVETHEAGQGQPGDKNAYRIAVKNNVACLLNTSDNDLVVYGGTFVGMNPAWGDEGCALPTTPDYLRPWSYSQGTFLAGQQIYNDKVELPEGYTIVENTLEDGRPVYTVSYNN